MHQAVGMLGLLYRLDPEIKNRIAVQYTLNH